MPTYNALGISASLNLVELEPTLTPLAQSRQGKSRQADLPRIKDVFSQGSELPERSIGFDDGGLRALQYIGEDGNLPLVMVEAGKHVKQHWFHQGFQHEGVSSRSAVSKSSVQSSRLLRSDTPMIDQARALSQLHDNDELSDTSTARGFGETIGAIQIRVDWTSRAHIPDWTSKGGNMDLRIEIFVNGILLGVNFQSRRYTSTDQKEKSYQLTGIRCHRQVEKPFVYHPQLSTNDTTKQRWEAIAESLRSEADQRGVNEFGDKPPSADFLLALSNLSLPKSLAKNNASVGIVDIVVTAGRGRKYGPETNYSTVCTRMDSIDYRRVPAAVVQTPLRQAVNGSIPTSTPFASVFETAVTPGRPSMTHAAPSSPEIPLVAQMKQRELASVTAHGVPKESAVPATLDSHHHLPATLQNESSDTLLKNRAEASTPAVSDRPSSNSRRSDRNTRSRKRDLGQNLAPIESPKSKKRRVVDLPMLPAPSKIRKTRSPPFRRVDTITSKTATSESASLASSSPVQASTRRIRDEMPENAVRDFQVPDLLSGSPVTIADGAGVFRQIAKERRGEFKEDSIVVGMRFIVA